MIPSSSSPSPFQERIHNTFIRGSGINPVLFGAIAEFHRDLETSYGGEASTPIHNAMGWRYTRFGRTTKDPLEAFFFRNKDGSIWQLIVSKPDQKGRPYSYLAPAGNGNRAYLPAVDGITLLKICLRHNIYSHEELERWLSESLDPEEVSLLKSHPRSALDVLLSETGLSRGGENTYSYSSEKGSLTYLSPSRRSDPDIQSLRSSVSQAQVSNALSLSPAVMSPLDLRKRFVAILQKLRANNRQFKLWGWIKDHPDELPGLITEGGKKSLSLLSQGFVAIGVYGCNCLRSPDLEPFLQGREVTIALDQDSKRLTRHKVGRAILKGGRHLARHGARVRVATWSPDHAKGIDDLLVQCGREAVEEAIGGAVSFDLWKHLHFPDLTYTQNVRCNQRYLGNLTLPNQGLVGIKSPKDTGKTWFLSQLCRSTNASVLLIGHRVNLLRNLAKRLSLDLYSDSAEGVDILRSPHLAITFDSLHKLPTTKHYDIVILDECEQGLDHLANSDTLKSKRLDCLLAFENFIKTAGTVIASDADLSDVSLNYLKAIREGENPYLIVNEFIHGGRQVDWFKDANALTHSLITAIESGEKPYVFTDSKAEVKRLQLLLSHQFPDLKIRTIHGDNSSEPDAQHFIQSINDRVQDVDALIVSPSVGTGISIDTEHFTQVYGFIIGGTLSATQVTQGLFRVRSAVPISLWVNTAVIGGYRETNPKQLKKQALDRHQTSGIFLKPYLNEEGEHEAANEHYLQLWAGLNARKNADLNRLAEAVRRQLQVEGHQIREVDSGPHPELKENRKQASLEVKQAEAKAIASAELLTAPEVELLERKTTKTEEERLQLAHYYLATGYGMDVTSELVLQDNQGRLLSGLKALDDLLSPEEIAAHRDREDRQRHKVITDQSHHLLRRHTRKYLGLEGFLDPDREFTAAELKELGEKVRAVQRDIKAILNLTIPAQASDGWILGTLLAQLGLKLTSRRPGTADRSRVYRLDPDTWNFAQQVLDYWREQRETTSTPPVDLINHQGVDVPDPFPRDQVNPQPSTLQREKGETTSTPSVDLINSKEVDVPEPSTLPTTVADSVATEIRKWGRQAKYLVEVGEATIQEVADRFNFSLEAIGIIRSQVVGGMI